MSATVTGPVHRSWLYAPAHDERLLGKVLGAGADAVVLDLEDAVPAGAKARARAVLRDWLLDVPPGSPEVWVRLNPGPAQTQDVAALRGRTALSGVVAAKSDSARDLARTRDVLDEHGLEAIALMPLVESAEGVLDVRAMAGVRGVAGIHLGEADLSADLGLTVAADELELLPARGAVVLASRAAGLAAPVGPVSGELRDDEVLRRSTRRLQRLGFVGRACIHPRQVEVAHEVFTPEPEALAAARALVELAAAHAREGTGAFVDHDGRFVDEAVVRSARTTLALDRATTSSRKDDPPS